MFSLAVVAASGTAENRCHTSHRTWRTPQQMHWAGPQSREHCGSLPPARVVNSSRTASSTFFNMLYTRAGMDRPEPESMRCA